MEYNKVNEAYNRFPYIQNAVNNSTTEAQNKVIKGIIKEDIKTISEYITFISEKLDKKLDELDKSNELLKYSFGIVGVDNSTHPDVFQLIELKRKYLARKEQLVAEACTVNDVLTLYEFLRREKI